MPSCLPTFYQDERALKNELCLLMVDDDDDDDDSGHVGVCRVVSLGFPKCRANPWMKRCNNIYPWLLPSTFAQAKGEKGIVPTRGSGTFRSFPGKEAPLAATPVPKVQDVGGQRGPAFAFPTGIHTHTHARTSKTWLDALGTGTRKPSPRAIGPLTRAPTKLQPNYYCTIAPPVRSRACRGEYKPGLVELVDLRLAS